MKINLAFLFVIASAQVHSQDQGNINRTQLKPLSYLIGNWKGTATIQQQGGAPIKVNQEEKITWQLDSMIINIEGIGRDITSNKKNFHAFALVYFNPNTQQLAMKSFTLEGRQTDAYFKLIGEDQFEWGFEVPNNRGKIKYLITLSRSEKKWKETGEFSPDGTKWYPFMTMDLVKQ
jgi:hypothetical protein